MKKRFFKALSVLSLVVLILTGCDSLLAGKKNSEKSTDLSDVDLSNETFAVYTNVYDGSYWDVVTLGSVQTVKWKSRDLDGEVIGKYINKNGKLEVTYTDYIPNSGSRTTKKEMLENLNDPDDPCHMFLSQDKKVEVVSSELMFLSIDSDYCDLEEAEDELAEKHWNGSSADLIIMYNDHYFMTGVRFSNSNIISYGKVQKSGNNYNLTYLLTFDSNSWELADLNYYNQNYSTITQSTNQYELKLGSDVSLLKYSWNMLDQNEEIIYGTDSETEFNNYLTQNNYTLDIDYEKYGYYSRQTFILK